MILKINMYAHAFISCAPLRGRIAAFAVCTWVFVLKIQAGNGGTEEGRKEGRKERKACEREGGRETESDSDSLTEQGSFKMSALKLMNLSSASTDSRFTYNTIKRDLGWHHKTEQIGIDESMNTCPMTWAPETGQERCVKK